MAYYPPSDKAGKFHKIEVRVRRPDLRVRARQGYVTPKPVARRKARSRRRPRRSNLMTPKLREALDSPLPVSGLVMNVFATPFKGAAPNASVLLGVEMRGRDLRLDPTDKVAVTYAVVGTDGKIRAGTTDALTMAITARDEDPRRRLGPPAAEARGSAAGPLSGSLRGARPGRRQRRIGAWPISRSPISRSCRSR